MKKLLLTRIAPVIFLSFLFSMNIDAQCSSVTITVTEDSGDNDTSDGTVCDGFSVMLTAVPDGDCSIPVTFDWSDDGPDDPDDDNAMITVTMSGTYTVTITDDNDDTATADVVVVVIPLPTIDTDPSDATVCEGDDAVFTVLASEGGGSPSNDLNYQWQVNTGGGFNNVGTNNSSITVTSVSLSQNGDFYRCIVTEGNGNMDPDCEVTSMVATLNVNADPILNYNAGLSVCANDLLTYTLVIDVPNVTSGNLSVVKNPNAGTTTITSQSGGSRVTISDIPVGTGNMNITFTDASTTCFDSDVYGEVSCTCPTVDEPTSSQTVYNLCTGDAFPTLTAIVNTGESVDWFDQASGGTAIATNTLTFTPTAAGSYFAEAYLVSADQCKSASRLEFTVTVNPLPTVSVTGPNEVCDEATINLNGSPSDSGTGVTWSSSNTSRATVNSAGVVTGVSPGPVTITYEFTDGNSCTNSTTHPVTVNPLPTVSVTGATEVCDDETIDLTGSPSDSGAGVSWSSSNTSRATVNTSGVVTAVSPGPVTITYEFTDANNCTNSTTQGITVNALPNVAISGADEVCDGDNTNLTGSPSDSGSGVTWTSSNPAIATVNSSGVVSSVMPGDVTINYEFTDGNNCTNSTTHPFTVNTLPTATITGPDELCDESTINLAGNPSSPPGVWSSNNSNASVTQIGQVTGEIPGDVTISYLYTDLNGCSDTATKDLTVNPLPSADAGDPTTICNGTNTQIGGNPETGSGGTAPYTYEWQPSVNLDDNTISNPTATPTVTTAYTVTVTDSKTCEATDQVIVSVNNLPNITDEPDDREVCETDDAMFVVIAQDGGGANTGNTLQYRWQQCTNGDCSMESDWSDITGPTGASATLNRNNIMLSMDGNQYRCKITDPNGSADDCETISAAARLTVNPLPTLSLTSDECADDLLTYDYIIDVPNVPENMISVTNNPAEGTITTVADGNGTRVTISGIDVGTGAMLVTILNTTTTCETSATFNEPLCECNDVDTPTSNQTDYFICDGDPIPTLTAMVAPGFKVAWYDQVSGGIPLENDALEFTPNSDGMYWAESYDELAPQCRSSVRLKFTITTNINPVVTLSSMGTPEFEFCDDGTLEIFANVINSGQSPAPYMYSWSMGAQGPNNSVTVTMGGNLIVTVTDANGCTGTASQVITAREAITLTAQITDVLCEGDNTGSINLIPSPTRPYAYAWTGPNSYTNGSEDPTGLFAGIYTVIVTDLQDGLCVQTAEFEVEEPELGINLETTVLSNAGCEGENEGSIDLAISGGNSPYTHFWTGPNAYTNNNEDINMLFMGQYTVIVTDQNDCTNTTFVDITEFDDPTTGIALTDNSGINDGEICDGDEAILTADPGFEYDWDTGDMTQEITRIVTNDPSVFNLIITDNNDCTGTASISVTVNSIPNAAIQVSETTGNTNNDDEFCLEDGAKITFSAMSIPANYQWSVGTSNTNVNEVSEQLLSSNPDGENFSVIITDNRGCVNQGSTVVKLFEPPNPEIINLTPSNEVGNDITFQMNADEVDNGDCDNVTYLWNFGDSETLQSINTDDVVHAYSASGDYNPSLTVTDACGCQASDEEAINIRPSGLCGITEFPVPSKLCVGEEITIQGVANATEDASCGQTLIQNVIRVNETSGFTIVSTSAGNLTVRFDDPGSFEVEYFIEDCLECELSVKKTVTVFGLPTASFDDDNLVACEDDDVDLKMTLNPISVFVKLNTSDSIQSNEVITISNIGATTNFTFSEVRLLNDPFCSADFTSGSDDVNVDVSEKVEFELLGTVCDEETQNYYEAQIQLSGGDGTFEVTDGPNPIGAPDFFPNAMIAGDILTIDFVQSEFNFNIRIQSDTICGSEIFSLDEAIACECKSKPGTFGEGVVIKNCESATFNLTSSYDNTEEEIVPSTNDVLVYFLSVKEVNVFDSDIIRLANGTDKFLTSPVFSFDDFQGINYNTEYFLFAAVLPEVAGEPEFLDPDDPTFRCEMRLSIPVEITFFENPKPGLLGASEVCSNQHDVYYEIMDGSLQANSDLQWVTTNTIDIVFPEDNERQGAFVTFPNDQTTSSINLIESKNNEGLAVCNGSTSINVTINQTMQATDRSILEWWEGNILICKTSDACYQWGEIIQGIDVPDANATEQFYFADPGLNLLGPNPDRIIYVDVYEKIGGVCNPTATGDCVTRNYFTSDQPILTNQGTVDENLIRAYPNPNMGEFTLNIAGAWGGKYDYIITDQLGNQLIKGSINKEILVLRHQVDINHLNNGVFYLTTINEYGDKKVQKIVKAQ